MSKLVPPHGGGQLKPLLRDEARFAKTVPKGHMVLVHPDNYLKIDQRTKPLPDAVRNRLKVTRLDVKPGFVKLVKS